MAVRAQPGAAGRQPGGHHELTHPAAVLVGDIANRAYRALWLLLGAAFTFDWSPRRTTTPRGTCAPPGRATPRSARAG